MRSKIVKNILEETPKEARAFVRPHVDFVIASKPLTQEDRQEISEFIRNYKKCNLLENQPLSHGREVLKEEIAKSLLIP